MFNRIVLKKGSGAPGEADLCVGEVAFDTTNSQLYGLDDSGNVQQLGVSESQLNEAKAGWTPVSTSRYTATPDSTSRLLMSDTTGFFPSQPIKYTIGGVTYLGYVSAISTNVHIDVIGYPLGGDVTALWIGSSSLIYQVDFKVGGTFADAADTDLLLNDEGYRFQWGLPVGRIVDYKVRVVADDTGANQPHVQISNKLGDISTANSGNGIEVSENYVGNGVDIDTWANCRIANETDGYIIVKTDAAGTNNNASGLMVSVIVVLHSSDGSNI